MNNCNSKESINPVSPAYLNKQFLTNCLRTGLEHKNLEIKDFEVNLATNPGDNFCSFIYRISIIYTNGISKNATAISLIVKSIPTDGDRAYLENPDVFVNEVNFYQRMLIPINQLLKTTKIAPECYYATSEPVRTIIFEDLKILKYSVADRTSGLDAAQCQVVLRKLAQFHAASMVILQNEPKFREVFKTGLYTKEALETQISQVFLRNNLNRGAEIVAIMPGYEQFAPILMRLYDNFLPKILQSTALDDNDIRVLCHSDLWVTNIMFKYGNQIPIDATFLDFQLTHCNTPALDLNFFFITSVQLEVLKKKEDLIRNFYYPVFVETLKGVGHDKIPSIEKLFNEIKNRELYTVFMLFGELPIKLLDKKKSTTNNYGEFINEEIANRTRDEGMSSERFIKTMQYALKYADRVKVFD